jgi:hypothetical protein
VTGTGDMTAAAPTTPSSHRSRTSSHFSSLTRLAATCAVGVCLLVSCAVDTASASPMNLTVSTVTDAPVTVWFDVRQRGESGQAGRGLPPTPVELSPEHPSVVLPVPYDHGYWLRVRVAGPSDRPTGTTVGCELHAADDRVLAVDATDPFAPRQTTPTAPAPSRSPWVCAPPR